jgi:glycosyltransferase involved in cell wall biosynthesis
MLASLLNQSSWSFTVHGPEEFDKAQAIGLREKLKACSFVVAISSYGRSQLLRLLPRCEWDKVAVVRCGVDAKFLNMPVPAPRGRRFVCIGRLSEQKGQLTLLQAAAILHSHGERFEIVLAGDGEMRRDLEDEISRHGLSSVIRITGWLDTTQIITEIQASRALVLPSFAEGLPVSIMEAMALKRPVISTFVAGIPELVSPANGWLVPAGDSIALAKAMSECLQASDSHLLEMGENGAAQVKQRHNIDQESKKLFQMFQSRVNPDDAYAD